MYEVFNIPHCGWFPDTTLQCSKNQYFCSKHIQNGQRHWRQRLQCWQSTKTQTSCCFITHLCV